MTQSESVAEKPLGLKNLSDAPLDAQTFRVLKQRRAVEKQLLPFLKTAVDFDIVCEIAFHEITRRTPLTVKHLILLGLAPQMTVFRRLNRLCNLGIIRRTRSGRDARVHELRVAESIHPLLIRYAGSTCSVDDAD